MSDLEEPPNEEPTAPKKQRAKKKPVQVEPYKATPGRKYDLVDGVTMLDGGTIKVEMLWSLGFGGAALNKGDLAVLPEAIAVIYSRKKLVKLL
jgi:hypothetical protein